MGRETSALRLNLFASPSPTLLENPSLAILSRHLQGSAQAAALLATRADLEQNWPKRGRRLDASFAQHERTLILRALPLQFQRQEIPADHRLLPPAPCTQSVFSQVYGGSHRHSPGCNMNLLSRLQDSPTSVIFFFCCSIFDSRIIPAPVLSVEIKHPSCSNLSTFFLDFWSQK